MSTEIELKAHVKDSEAMRLLLMEKAVYGWAFEKEDSYFVPAAPLSPTARIRLRRERRSYPDGSNDSFVFLTCKMKKIADGIEVNDEKEFEIRSPQGAAFGYDDSDFENFLKMTGCKLCALKRKEGWLFSKGELHAELAKVEGLLWFLELEILAGDDKEETVSCGKAKLLSFLGELGIKKEAIESRFYTDMLKDKQ